MLSLLSFAFTTLGARIIHLHKIVVQSFLRDPDCLVESATHQRILLRLPLACLPPLLVGAGKEVSPHLGLAEHRVPAHAVHETLELVHPMLDEFLLIST